MPVTLPAAAAFQAEPMSAQALSDALVQVRDFVAQHLGTAGTPEAALQAIGALVSGVRTMTAAGSVAAADRGRTILASGTWTLALGASATLGAGFACVVVNTGSGTITLDPDASEQIDGATTAALGAGRAALLLCDGGGWRSLALPGSAAGQTLIAAGTAAAPGLAFPNDTDTGLWRIAADTLGIAAGGAERARVTTGGMQVTGTVTGTAVTQTATDTTAGRLLKTGDFGLGVTGGAPVLADFDAVDTPSGFWRTDTTTANRPAAFPHAFGRLELTRHGTEVLGQVWRANYGLSGGPAEVWSRGCTGGSWRPWQLAVHMHESGSNSNGTWARYTDGRQVCEITGLALGTVATTEGSLFRSADLTWTFPAAFATATGLVVSGSVANIGAWLSAGLPTASTVSVRGYAAASIGTSQTVRLRAEGFWK